MNQPSDIQSSMSQYSLQSILWMTTAVALLLAYARNLGPRAVQLLAVYVACWLACIAVTALLAGNRKELLFWSGLIVVEAFLAVSAVKLLNENLAYGWGLVAAVSGTVACVRHGKHILRLSLINAALSFAAMAAVMGLRREPLGIESSLDLAGAAGVGFTVTFFVQFLIWFTRQTRQPWPVVAAWLTIFVLIGNWLQSR